MHLRQLATLSNCRILIHFAKTKDMDWIHVFQLPLWYSKYSIQPMPPCTYPTFPLCCSKLDIIRALLKFCCFTTAQVLTLEYLPNNLDYQPSWLQSETALNWSKSSHQVPKFFIGWCKAVCKVSRNASNSDIFRGTKLTLWPLKAFQSFAERNYF